MRLSKEQRERERQSNIWKRREYHIQIPMPGITAGARPTPRHGGCKPSVVLAMVPGNRPAVRVWTAKTGGFGSRPVEKPDRMTLGGPNMDLYLSTRGFRRVWLNPSVQISGSAVWVSHLWSHSYMLLLIVKY